MSVNVAPKNHANATLVVATPQELIALRLKLHENGYHPVPVVGARVQTNSAGKRPTMSGWQTKCLNATPQQITAWSWSQSDCTNTGLLCGKIVGIDIDVLDGELSVKLVALALEFLGPTPLSRIGRAPKTLLLYQVATPFKKKQTPELMFGDDAKPTKVEILADGQQFVAFGIHPDTNAPYSWPELSPLDVLAADVPLISEEQLQKFVVAAEEVLRNAGGQTKADIKDQEQKGNAAAGLRKDERPTREKIADALDHIVNDLPYDDWIKIGFALYDGLGATGEDLWNAFSAGYKGNDPRTVATKWTSFGSGRSVKVATLFWYAKQNGWWWKDGGTNDATTTPGEPTKARPEIKVVGGNLHHIVTEGEQALIAANLGLYQRGSMMVRPTLMHVDIADHKTTMAMRLAAVRLHLLVEIMTKSATWLRFDIRKNDFVAIDCPEKIANTLLAREQWGLPILAGIVNCPVLRPDGSVLQTPGHDVATGLVFDPQGTQFNSVPENPSKEDARLALDVLKDLVKTFPFVSQADESVALSAILTAIHRRSLPTAPLHGFTAPGAGSGKSKLVDIASLIVDGREAAVMSLGRSEEESEKRLGAALLAGDAIISIDNIDSARSFGGELFCQALTQKMLKIRILGLSKLEVVPTNAFICANGNNLTLEGDMTRRAIMCTIDSGEERPELRVFKTDPLAMVRADRDKYVMAALTVLRAYYVAGKPAQPVIPLGSFEEWSAVIRGALLWLGEADPCATMEKVRRKDPKLGAMITVITQWLEVIGQDSVTAKALIECAVEKVNDGSIAPWKQEFTNPEFRDALLIVAGEGGAINSLKLGKWLAANQDRFVEGHKIVQRGTRSGSNLWKLEPKGFESSDQSEASRF